MWSLSEVSKNTVSVAEGGKKPGIQNPKEHFVKNVEYEGRKREYHIPNPL
jgi:hypothetical protein